MKLAIDALGTYAESEEHLKKQFDEIKDDFNTLQAQPNVPAYLEEAFGDYWAAKGSPHKALAIYQAIEQQVLTNKLAVSKYCCANSNLPASLAVRESL